MLGQLYSRTGSSFPLDIWQSTIQVSSLRLHGSDDICNMLLKLVFYIYFLISLREGATEVATKSWKEQAGNTAVFAGGKIVRAAIKVLDECLRAISGFRGTKDFFGFPIYF
ncbi:hypothetical protein HRI_002234300 [Hibiscus trionum]|uniref:Uncharacterized protein n=1 Tax=Hibiscus trionum TaxID=183268 RepID=A0A9W7HWF8_HIBTR|nr:hypothetical protein HRI_002234300 [Hibiscus trionum]